MKKFLFILWINTIFTANASSEFLKYKNCSSIELSSVSPSLSLKDLPQDYIYITKNYNFITLPISKNHEKYCLVINNKNKVIVDAIPIMLDGMCGGEWSKKNETPTWVADVAGGRGSVDYFYYKTDTKLKNTSKSDTSSIKEIISNINCQLSTYTKDDLLELNNSAFYLYQFGYYQDSLNILNYVVKIDPNRTVAYLNIADTYLALKNESQAKNYYLIYVNKMKKAGLIEKVPSRVKKYLYTTQEVKIK